MKKGRRYTAIDRSTRRKELDRRQDGRNVSEYEGGRTGRKISKELTTRLVAFACFSDVPFELVGKVAGAGAMAETSDIESCAPSSRHFCRCKCTSL